jgi:hypothetical protein
VNEVKDKELIALSRYQPFVIILSGLYFYVGLLCQGCDFIRCQSYIIDADIIS